MLMHCCLSLNPSTGDTANHSALFTVYKTGQYKTYKKSANLFPENSHEGEKMFKKGRRRFVQLK